MGTERALTILVSSRIGSTLVLLLHDAGKARGAAILDVVQLVVVAKGLRSCGPALT